MSAAKKKSRLFSVALVILAVVLGSNFSLHALSGEALNAYQKERWGNTTIKEDTQAFATKINNYLKVVTRYVDNSDEDVMSLRAIAQTLGEQGDSPKNILLLNTVEEKVDNLTHKSQGLNINSQDQKYIQSFIEEWKGFIYILSNHPYNPKALSLNEALAKFPARGLKYLTSVRELPVYRSEIIEKK